MNETKAHEHFAAANSHFQKQEFEKAIQEFSNAIKEHNEFARAYLFRGIIYFNLKKYKEADEDFCAAIAVMQKQNEQDESAKELTGRSFFMRAKARRQLSKLQDALKDLNEAMSIYSTATAAAQVATLTSMYMERALVHDYLNKNVEAVNDYSKFLEASNVQPSAGFQPLVYQAYYNRGLALQQLNKAREALDSFQQAIEYLEKTGHKVDKSHASVYYQVAHTLQQLEQSTPEQLIAAYEKVLPLDPEHTGAHRQLGVLHFERGDYGLALLSFSVIVQATPASQLDYSTVFNRGVCYKVLGHIHDAIDDFKKVVEHQPTNLAALIQLAKALKKSFNHSVSQLEYEEAIDVYTKAVNLIQSQHQSDAEWQRQLTVLYFERGMLFAKLTRVEEAVADFSSCLDNHEKGYHIQAASLPDVYFNRATMYHRELKDFKSAISDYNKVLELTPDDVDVLTERGVLYYDLGVMEAAQKDWQRVVQLDPNHELANQFLQACKL